MARPRKTYLGSPSVHKGRQRVWWGGRWHDLGPAGSQQARAEYARLAALVANDPTATILARSDYLVADLCADYLASAEAPQGRRQRQRVLIAVELLRELHLTTAVSEFGPNDLRAWQSWLCSLRRDDGTQRFNVTSINHHVGAVKRIWKWGVSTERVPVDRAAALATVRRPRPGEARAPRVVEPADLDHVRATLPHLRPQVRAMVVLQLATGARPGEVCGMRPCDVHRGGKLHVPGAGVQDLDALGVWCYLPPVHKSTWRGKPRFLVLGAEAQWVLAPYLERDPDAYCFSPREAVLSLRQSERDAAATRSGKQRPTARGARAGSKRPPGELYTPTSYCAAVRRGAERAKVPKWFPYQLRHLAAAQLKALYDLDAVAALLGHHTRTMAEHYGGAAFTRAAEVAKARNVAGEHPQTEL